MHEEFKVIEAGFVVLELFLTIMTWFLIENGIIKFQVVAEFLTIAIYVYINHSLIKMLVNICSHLVFVILP